MTDTNEQVQLFGWEYLQVPTRAIFELTNRALRIYCYLIFRARDKGQTWPGVARMVEELGDLSDRTAKRALKELADKKWIVRKRRFGSSTLTIVFPSPEKGQEYIEQACEWANGGPSNGPMVARRMGQCWPDMKEDSEKENSEEAPLGSLPQSQTNGRDEQKQCEEIFRRALTPVEQKQITAFLALYGPLELRYALEEAGRCEGRSIAYIETILTQRRRLGYVDGKKPGPRPGGDGSMDWGLMNLPEN